jgi:hypothetical protein
MGLLDNFDTPEMAFSMGLLGSGGPSLRPVSLGQGLAAGYGNAMQAKDRMAQNKRLEQQLAMQQQQAELQKMQMQEIQRKLSEENDIRNALRTYGGQQQQPQQMQPQQPVNAFGGGMSTLDPQAAPQRQPASAKTTQYQRLMGVGDMLTNKGYGDKAQAYYDQAAKLAPKVKDWKQVNVGGAIKYAPLFEDGTTGQPMEYEAATELHFADNGTNTGIGINKFTGGQVTGGVKKGYTPGDMVSMRGQNMVDSRTREANAESAAMRRDAFAQGNKPPSGYRVGRDGETELVALTGGPTDLKAQALAQQKAIGSTDVDIAISSLRDAYNRLDEGGGVTSTNKKWGSNAGAYLSSSSAGQMAGKMFGTDNQSARNDIAMTRPALLAALMKATGMSAKQMDSNAELKLWLSTATDSTLDVESNRRALDKIEKKYMPGAVQPVNPNTQPSAPSAPKIGTVQGGYVFMGGNPADPARWKKARP